MRANNLDELPQTGGIRHFARRIGPLLLDAVLHRLRRPYPYPQRVIGPTIGGIEKSP